MIQERDVLAQLHHPLLCNMQYAFQDALNLYMVLDVMSGGDLRYYLRRYTLSEEAIKVIIGEIACAIEYVHEKSLIHRDVKPDNILLDERGHAHLCDFNAAVRITAEQPLLSGISGTFNYLAPEEHYKRNHGKHLPWWEQGQYGEQVDWWALGVVMYECLYGKVPFRAKSQDEMVTLMRAGPRFPPTENPPVSSKAIMAIKPFLMTRPDMRIRTCYDVFKLDFFGDLSRTSIEQDYLAGKPGPVGFRATDVLEYHNGIRVNAVDAMIHDAQHWDSRADPAGYVKRGEQHANHRTRTASLTRLRHRLQNFGLGLAEHLAGKDDRNEYLSSGMWSDGEDDDDFIGLTAVGSRLDSTGDQGRAHLTCCSPYAPEFRTFITRHDYNNSLSSSSEHTLFSLWSDSSHKGGSGGKLSNNGLGSNLFHSWSRSRSQSSTNISSGRDGSDWEDNVVKNDDELPKGIIAIGRAGRGARYDPQRSEKKNKKGIV